MTEIRKGYIVPNSVSDEIGNGRMLRLGSVLGVGVMYNVFLMNAETTQDHIIILASPESGPREWIQQWASNPQDVEVFSVDHLDYPAAMERALSAAVALAVKDVRDNMG